MNKGDEFEQKFAVTDAVYNGFKDIFNDQNPLHVDEQYAKEKGFDREVMYGNILNGFISFFIGECLPKKNVILQSQEIFYQKPVYLNDELIFKAKVSEVYESVNAVEFKYQFLNQDTVKVARGKIQVGFI